MKLLFDVRSCRNCNTSFAWLRKMITALPDEIETWDDIIKSFGVNCCDNPEMNNTQWEGMFYFEVVN